MDTRVSSEIVLTRFPVIKGPGKTPPASTVLSLSVNTTSRIEYTKNERAAEPIRSKIGIRDLKLGSGADGGGDAPRDGCNEKKEGQKTNHRKERT